jgi:hypothetical protein
MYSSSSTDSSDSELLEFHLFAQEQDHSGHGGYSFPDDSFDDVDPRVIYLEAEDDARPWDNSNRAALALPSQVGKLQGLGLDLAHLADCRAQKRRRLVKSAISLSAADFSIEHILCLPAADPVSNSVTTMADSWPMDVAVHSSKKRKRRSPKGARGMVSSKGKGAPRSRKGRGRARKDKPPSKKAAAAARRSPFKSEESISGCVRVTDAMGRSLELAIATARALELHFTSYKLRQEELLSESLAAGRTDMLTWRQAEVIIQALEAGLITLARRPLTGTEVEHPPYHFRALNPSAGRCT